jgi:hypothetical protein
MEKWMVGNKTKNQKKSDLIWEKGGKKKKQTTTSFKEDPFKEEKSTRQDAHAMSYHRSGV